MFSGSIYLLTQLMYDLKHSYQIIIQLQITILDSYFQYLLVH